MSIVLCERASASPEVRRATLPSGARVVAARVEGAADVSIRVAWAAGFAEEPADQRGVANLLAAASVVRCAARDTAAEAASLGGELAGVAGRWSAGLRGRWPRATWEDGLDLVADCVARPSLDRATVIAARARLVALARGVAASPARNAFLAFLATRWGAHPLGRAPLASATSLASLDRPAVERWWRARHAPSAAVFVIAGDVDPDAAIAALRARLADAPAAAPPPEAPADLERSTPPIPAVRQVFVDARPGTGAAVVVGLPGLAADHADRPLLDGLVALLADPAGRLRAATAAAGMRSLRVTAVDGPDTGYLALELEGVSHPDAALVAIERTLAALVADGPTPTELDLARAALAAPPTAAAHADRLAHAELRGTAPRPAPPPPTAAALQRLAADLLRWDAAVIATARPAAPTPGATHRATRRLPARRRGGRR